MNEKVPILLLTPLFALLPVLACRADNSLSADTARMLGYIFGVTDDPGFGAVHSSKEADIVGDKEGLADVNPAGPQIVVDVMAGYHSNPAMEIDRDDRSSIFTSAALRFSQRLSRRNFDLYWGVIGQETLYDRTPISREQDDQSITDVNVRLGGGVNISQSARLSTLIDHFCGGHLQLNQGVHRTGISPDQIKRFENRTVLDLRLDGQELGSAGFQTQFLFNYLNFEGEKLNDWDFDTIGGGGTAYYYIPGTDTCVKIEGSIREKRWDRWTQFDSESVSLSIGVEGRFPCGVNWEGEVGYECRDYDDYNLNDREEPFVSTSVRGHVAPRTFIVWDFYYGIGDLYNNQGGMQFVDSMTIRNSVGIVQNFGNFNARLAYANQNLEPDISGTFLTGTGDSMNIHQLSAGIDYKMTEAVRIGAELGYGFGDYGFGSNDDFSYKYATLRSTFRF